MKISSRLARFCNFWAALLLAAWSWQAAAAEESRTFRIYLDADRSNSGASARAIEMGVRAAFARTELHPDGVVFDIVAQDHRGNVKRSLRNLKTMAEDPEGLVVFGGMHSPPYLTYREWINENGVLMLLPWSAAGPITRTEQPVNWIFRASVDDTKAGAFLAESAMVHGGCTSPAILVLNSGWGRFNQKMITRALAEHGIEDPPSFEFERTLSNEMSRVTARDILRTGADCIIFVGVTEGGAEILTELAEARKGIRVFSHWGILGGGFLDRTTADTREELGLSVLQTCMPFGSADHPALEIANASARALFPGEFTRLEDVEAPVGFAHGYDLGLILMAALRTVPLEDDIRAVRARVRTALESLDTPVEGLMKTYHRPFSAEGFDAHEALGAQDLCLARFDAKGRIVFGSATN